MTRHGLRRIGIVSSLCGLAGIAVAPRTAHAVRNLKPGDPLPAFALPRGDGAPGQYQSEQLKGQPTAVVFWRPGQKLSLEALADLEAMAKEIGADKLHVVAVDAARSSVEQVRTALAGQALSFPILLDPQRELYGKVGVIVCPTTLLLDARGVLRFVVVSHARTFAQVTRARLQFLLGQIDESQMNKAIEPTVLKIEHELAAAWRMYNLGRKLQTEGRPDQAAQMYEKAVSQYPSLAEARCALGFLKLSAGDLSGADQDFRSALAYKPISPSARLGQAIVLARTGQPEQAEPVLLSLLGQRSVAARARYELGRIYRARGEIDKAVTFFENALAVVFVEPATNVTRPKAPLRRLPAASPRVTSVRRAPATATASPTRRLAAVDPITPPANAHYTGLKSCKKCHFQQWQSWKKTKMAAAFDMLKPGAGTDVKQARRLDPTKDYTTDESCLACHTTGFGRTGGYAIPAPGDARAGRAAALNAGITCEACHGPGNEYARIHKDIQDRRRKYTQSELVDAGQYPVNARVCAACHNEAAPCIPAGQDFDFEKRKEQGTHQHFELQFRAQ